MDCYISIMDVQLGVSFPGKLNVTCKILHFLMERYLTIMDVRLGVSFPGKHNSSLNLSFHAY